ncbi:hypothetical protein A1O1_04598 [Capronia coronata CBS 617.96]|uniref:HMA domain-containing protein n=1 Tax=Capronia coronata CBS 617.96 TaxID=1182541 RepID=W9YZE7_9EURO|nr:uncharacterized protein A1O1_04598 [Capronia coronata CBS 617.96]EXJ87674.1 hypothetical protein A1O1_04598 [Capronia coronata CBS 617.96]
MAFTSSFLVSNIHCPSCVSYAQDVLREVPSIQSVHVSLIDHTIRVKHEHDKARELIVRELLKAAFEVQHVTTIDTNGVQVYDHDVSPSDTASFVSRSTWFQIRAQRKHIENCKACQEKRAGQSTRRRSWAALIRSRRHRDSHSRPNESSTLVSEDALANDLPAFNFDGAAPDAKVNKYAATISVGGMTCASCSGTISNELSKLDFVESVDVNLMSNAARVVYNAPKETCDKIVETIDDLGYEATLEDVTNLSRKDSSTKSAKEYKILLSIGGMTCGSCVGTITRGLEELLFVRSADIDLVGNRGVVYFEDEHNLDALLEKVDDLGYDCAVVKVEGSSSSPTPGGNERVVQIKIDGMYCEHCPENIRSALQNALPAAKADGHQAYTITQLPTLQNPIVTIAYRPAPPDVTVRSFISAINAAHEAFHASVYHPPTLEERSRRLQHKEQKHILYRLLFTAIVAMPTFIIGVVYMSLVPKSNSTRQWFEEPILAGNAMRMEWALFFLTTPVMFYGTDLFHVRALKEIKSMWRPRSKVPILRRFYRFGSMNLLISTGASVAYFSSLAVLIMDATTKRTSMDHDRSSDTYFDTVTFLTFFILIGRFLEAYSKAKTGDAVAMLSNLRPSDALLLEDTRSQDSSGNIPQPSIRRIPVDQLEVGDIVQIPHGTSPPTDGVIDQRGTFLFDESSLTGESKPVRKSQGDEVYTGSVNVSDPVRVKVTEVGGTSMLDQIVNVVREGQAKRAPVERVADIITGYFVPVITLLAIITWVVWLGLGESGRLPKGWLDVSQGGWPFWSVEFAVAVFVVACPCGVGLAAPTALFVGGGLAAKHGILVQGGGEAFQEASRLDAIVFDKTGTLTEGQMRVTEFELLHRDPTGGEDMVDEQAILAVSRLMEESSTHPIAKAIAEYCLGKSATVPVEPIEVKEIPGQGMMATFNLKNNSTTRRFQAVLGNEKFLMPTSRRGTSESTSDASMLKSEKEANIVMTDDFFLTPVLRKHQSLGHSTAIFAIRTLPQDAEKAAELNVPFHPLALFAIADPIRAEAPSVLDSLRHAKLDVHMCTGDNQTTALAIAAQLGIPVSNVRAGVLPQDKAAYIQELQGGVFNKTGKLSNGRRVIAFVGDGTNDTPALSAADVSIALSSGSDVAVTTASFILLNSDLTTILSLVRLAHRVFLRVKLNFAWAAVYNLCLVPVAAGVFFPIGATDEHGGWRLSPVWASLAMAASSVSVVMSSLALKLPELRWGKV